MPLCRPVIYRGNDTVVEFGPDSTDYLSAAISTSTDTTVAAAAVNLRVLSLADVELLACTTMPAVADESGNYRGIVPDTLDLSGHNRVYLEVEADNGANAFAKWKTLTDVEDRQ